jgi:hypothetical protein
MTEPLSAVQAPLPSGPLPAAHQPTPDPISQAVADLDAWLETMRAPGGYGGPVAHWWSDCLAYTGPGLDWRYEGIISGYLTLWQRTGHQGWLEKALRAGDDLVRGQLPGGNFRHSTFELNPYSGGTPHEAAASLGLLRLALALRRAGHPGSSLYARAAGRNIRAFLIGRLWDPEIRSFRDHPGTPSLVPNKICTLAETLFAWARWQATDKPVERYGLPALEVTLALQNRTPGPLHGAIAQNQLGRRVIPAYFPYYNARCLPALILAYRHTGHQRWLDAAARTLAFITRQVDECGRLPQVLYRRGHARRPSWIAALGDVLRAARLMESYGQPFELQTMESALLAGRLPGGAFATARGFGVESRWPGRSASPPDWRDALPAAGWCDKAFRYLAALVPAGRPLPQPQTGPVTVACRLRGRPALWRETGDAMTLAVGDSLAYRWLKGAPWADVLRPEVLGS